MDYNSVVLKNSNVVDIEFFDNIKKDTIGVVDASQELTRLDVISREYPFLVNIVDGVKLFFNKNDKPAILSQNNNRYKQVNEIYADDQMTLYCIHDKVSVMNFVSKVKNEPVVLPTECYHNKNCVTIKTFKVYFIFTQDKFYKLNLTKTKVCDFTEYGKFKKSIYIANAESDDGTRYFCISSTFGGNKQLSTWEHIYVVESGTLLEQFANNIDDIVFEVELENGMIKSYTLNIYENQSQTREPKMILILSDIEMLCDLNQIDESTKTFKTQLLFSDNIYYTDKVKKYKLEYYEKRASNTR